MMADWCRLPAGMKCVCLSDSRPSYERLGATPHVTSSSSAAACNSDVTSSAYELADYPDNKDSSNEKQEELSFFNDDGSYQVVTVERNLRAADLCQLLAVKNRTPKDPRWTLYEHWIDLGLERPLEDHEDVLRAHRDMQGYSRRSEKRFVFRKDFRKYEFFRDPQNFFPSDMVVPGAFQDFLNTGDNTGSGDYHVCAYHHGGKLHNQQQWQQRQHSSSSNTTSAGGGVSLCSAVWTRSSGSSARVWTKAYMLLAGTALYLARGADAAARAMRDANSISSDGDKDYHDATAQHLLTSSSGSGAHAAGGDSDLQYLCDIRSYQVYATLNARNHYRAPAEYGLCLRPTRVAAGNTAGGDTATTTGVAGNTTTQQHATDASSGGGHHHGLTARLASAVTRGGSGSNSTAGGSNASATVTSGGYSMLDDDGDEEDNPSASDNTANVTSHGVTATANVTSSSTTTTAGGGESGGGLICVACDTERQRTGWLTAVRLAKYGKQLRENYRAFKNKGDATMQGKDYAAYTMPNESLRSRVAMDFTGPAGGRIVEDPLEARAVAAAEGCSWKRRWRPTQRKQPPPHHILALASANNTAVVQPMMMQQQQNNHRTTASQQQQQNNYNSMSPPANQHNQPQQHAYQHQQHRNDSPAHNQQQQNQTDLYNSSGTTTTTTEQQQYFTTNSLHQGLQPQMSRGGGGGGEHVSRHQQRQMSLSPNGGVGYNSQYGGSSTNQQNLSHLSKPWFHVGVTREQAAAILLNRQQRPTGDGIFLVRESRSSPTRGHFVLTYRHSGRACHAHIRPMAEPLAATTTNTNATNTAAPNHHSHHSHPHGQQQYHQHGGGNNQQQQQQQQTVTVYSLDGGNTKFYDLQQLVEFYQLNAGTTLPVRLTHYVSRDDNNCLTFQQQNGAGGGVMTTPGSF